MVGATWVDAERQLVVDGTLRPRESGEAALFDLFVQADQSLDAVLLMESKHPRALQRRIRSQNIQTGRTQGTGTSASRM